MQNSIAVLPFRNMCADPDNEYFSDGITEEIINALAQIDELKVTARTSCFAFKNKDIDIRTIGETLDVKSILEGSVRKVDNRVRITAQLINVDDGYHLFSKTYERELKDIFAIQEEISLLIADRLKKELGQQVQDTKLARPTTTNIDAYEFYLKGKHLVRKWNGEDIFLGFEYLNKAIELQPDFALPRLELDHGYTFMGSLGILPSKTAFYNGWKQIEQAQAINPDLPELLVAKASHFFWHEWNANKAIKYLQKAIEIRPSYPDAFTAVAVGLMYQGQYAAANEWLEKAAKLDPLSHSPIYLKGMCAYWQHDFQEALNAMDQSIDLNPHSWSAYLLRGLCFLNLGRHEEGIQAFRDMPEMEISEPDRIGGVALGKLLMGDKLAGKEGIRKLEKEIPGFLQSRCLMWKICLNAQLGEIENAIDLVEQAINDRFGLVVSFTKEKYMEPLYSHSRFQNLMEVAMQDMGGTKSIFSKYKSSKVSAEQANAWLFGLKQLMKEEEVFLDPELNLRGLAKKLKIHPNHLSQLINEKFGKNFNNYINSLRLKYFVQLAHNPQFAHLSLLGLAYESGFKSKTVFNTYFKKEMGTTPSAFLRKSNK